MKYLHLFENFEIHTYEHGRCELFAYVLHKVMGYELYFHVDDEAEIETEEGYNTTTTALVHAYCKDVDGNLYDATGRIEYSELEEHSDWVNEPRDILVSEELFNQFISDGFIGEYTSDEYNDVESYIIENKVLYQTTLVSKNTSK